MCAPRAVYEEGRTHGSAPYTVWFSFSLFCFLDKTGIASVVLSDTWCFDVVKGLTRGLAARSDSRQRCLFRMAQVDKGFIMMKMFGVRIAFLFTVYALARGVWAVEDAGTTAKSVANRIFKGHVLGIDGKPIAGAKVVLKSESTGKPVLTNPDGIFEYPLPFILEPFERSTFVFEASCPDNPVLRGILMKKIGAGDALSGDIMMTSLGTIRGKVLDKDGKPIPATEIATSIILGAIMPDRKVGCDAAGQFEIKDAIGGATYFFLVTAKGPYGQVRIDQNVVDPGSTWDVGTLVIPVADKSIKGMVKDEDEKTVAGAALSFRGSETGLREAKSDENGSFSFENVVADETVHIEAWQDRPNGRLHANVTATAGETAVEVTLEKESDGNQATSLIGKEAPALDVATWLTGEATALKSLHGAPVVLAFCKSEDKASEALLVLLNQIGKQFPKIPVLALYNADADQAVLKKTIDSPGVIFRVAIDKADATTKQYKARVPSVYLIGADGKVRYQDLAFSVVEKTLQSMLDGK